MSANQPSSLAVVECLNGGYRYVSLFVVVDGCVVDDERRTATEYQKKSQGRAGAAQRGGDRGKGKGKERAVKYKDGKGGNAGTE